MTQQPQDWTTVGPESRWSLLMKQKRFTMWTIYASLGSMMMGFDWGMAGTATAFPAFQKTMGIPYPSQPSGYLIPANVQAAWSAVSTCGDALGMFASGMLMGHIGRKNTIMVGNIVTAIGVVIQMVSSEWKLFLGGRLINAIGFGTCLIVGPVWLGETALPELRGTFLCFTNGMIIFGQFVLALVAYGTDSIEGQWSYKTLIVLQFAFILALLLPWYFFPESPYYHLQKGRKDQARRSLKRAYGKVEDSFIETELQRLQETIIASDELAAAAGSGGPLLIQAFNKTNRRRTWIAILSATSQQFIGAAFVMGYITYFLSLLGIAQYFTVSAVLYTCMLLSNISAFPLIEVVGRRPLLVCGMFFLTAVELIMGIMGVINNAAALWVTLVCIFLWAIAYQVSVGAVGYALPGEVASPPMRAITMSIAGTLNCLSGWLIAFVTPYLINPDAASLGAKVGFVFVGLGLPMCVLFWFFIPEVKGLTFNELDQLFEEKVSPRRFKQEAQRRRSQAVIASPPEVHDEKEHAAMAVETEVGSTSV